MLWFKNPPSVLGIMPKNKEEATEKVSKFSYAIADICPFELIEFRFISHDFLLIKCIAHGCPVEIDIEWHLKQHTIDVKYEVDYATRKRLRLPAYVVHKFHDTVDYDYSIFNEETLNAEVYIKAHTAIFNRIFNELMRIGSLHE